jgi:hypothetical protein
LGPETKSPIAAIVAIFLEMFLFSVAKGLIKNMYNYHFEFPCFSKNVMQILSKITVLEQNCA